MPTLEKLKSNYIILYNDYSARFDGGSEIDLLKYLPNNLKKEEIAELIQIFEDQYNELYDGDYGYNISEVNVSADYDSIIYNRDNRSDPNSKISILEKIKRLSDLQDPDLINAQYLQYLAQNMGYDVNINRSEFGNFGVGNDTVTSAYDQEKYLRFVVSNLPNLYKIKTTESMIIFLLYSFGLIGSVKIYYTKDYQNNWKIDYEGNLSEIPNDWYPTSHFIVLVDLDATIQDLTNRLKESNRIIRAIESVRPINDVFKGLAAKSIKDTNIKAGAIARLSRYLKIGSGGASDYWRIYDLVGWYKGEDNLNDSTGGNTALWNQDPKLYETGVAGKCFSMTTVDGYGSQIKIPNNNQYDFGSSGKFAFEFYVNPSTFWDVYFRLASDDTGTIYGFNVRLKYGSAGVAIAADNVAFIKQLYTETLAPGVWSRVKITYDGTIENKWELYIDDMNNPKIPTLRNNFSWPNNITGKFLLLIGNGLPQGTNTKWDEFKIYRGI